MKDKMEYLEELYIAELPDYKHPYPPQLKKSVAKKLIEEGLVKEVEILEPALRLICHQLTHFGMLTYCEWVSKQMNEQEKSSRSQVNPVETSPSSKKTAN